MVLATRRTLRNDQDSPRGLQMCMPSASPGLDMLPGRWVVHSSPHWPRRALRQPARSLTALRVVGENTVSKTLKSLSAPQGDVARPPGLSGRTANVYGECFSRFRHDGASLGGSWHSTLVLENWRQTPRSLTALCTLRETLSRRQENNFLPRRETLRDRQDFSDWSANVYGECFSRFRDAAGLLCVA